jgi:hypothetical protein
VHGVVENQRNELFRKLIGAVVVGTVGYPYRQAVGVKIGGGEMIGSGLGGGIG